MVTSALLSILIQWINAYINTIYALYTHICKLIHG